MSSCRKCGCRCDPGDLQGGVCDDCREEERQKDMQLEWRMDMLARNIAEQADGQLTMLVGGSKDATC